MAIVYFGSHYLKFQNFSQERKRIKNQENVQLSTLVYNLVMVKILQLKSNEDTYKNVALRCLSNKCMIQVKLYSPTLHVQELTQNQTSAMFAG